MIDILINKIDARVPPKIMLLSNFAVTFNSVDDVIIRVRFQLYYFDVNNRLINIKSNVKQFNICIHTGLSSSLIFKTLMEL